MKGDAAAGAIFVIVADAVVLVESEISVGTGIYIYFDGVRRCLGRRFHRLAVRHYGTGLREDRAPAVRGRDVEPRATRFIDCTRMRLVPAACRQVESAAAAAIFINGADEKGVAEHILVRELAADRVVAEIHSHRAHYRIVVEPGAGGQCIYIR